MPSALQRLQAKERLLLDRAESMVYGEPSTGPPLKLHLFLPKDLESGGSRAALLFFHGGNWDGGKPVQFAPHALHFVSRGAVCALVEYRTAATHPESSAENSHGDCRAAIRHIRAQAERLRIDPAKVVALGAGAGGNLAACAAMGWPAPATKASDRDDEPAETEARVGSPDAAVLISAIIDVEKEAPYWSRFRDAAGARASSLRRQVRGGAAPMLLLHGTEDRLVPFETAKDFAAAMERRKNVVELAAFEGRGRDFFNFTTDPHSFEACLEAIDEFLAKRGMIPAVPDAGKSCHVISWREDDF